MMFIIDEVGQDVENTSNENANGGRNEVLVLGTKEALTNIPIPEVSTSDNEVSAEVTDSVVFDDQHCQWRGSTISEELDDVPTKYVASKMDILNAERGSTNDFDEWKIEYDQGQHAFCGHFKYNDVDTIEVELGEIYGYYELSSLSYNFDMFHMYLEGRNMKEWCTSKLADKYNFIDDVLDDLELVDVYKRYDALLAITYLTQGCWKDLETSIEQLQCIEDNIPLLLQCNGFWRVWNLFTCIADIVIEEDSVQWAWGINERIMENCLNVLCAITCVAFRKQDDSSVQEFISELRSAEGDAALVIVLDCFSKCVVQLTSQSFLLKKLLILARNLILLSVGGFEELRITKDECRKAAGLKPSKEDTILTCQKIDIIQKNSGWNNLKDAVNMMTFSEMDELTRNVDVAEKLLASSADQNSSKLLPWCPKASTKTLGGCMKDSHLFKIHPKLKIPITMQQKVHQLLQHLHVPLSEFHLQQEKLIKKYPRRFSGQEKPLVERADQMFLALVPVLETSMNTMMVVLAEAAPPSNPVQVDPKNRKTFLPFIPRYGGDADYFVEDSLRQAEIIAKTISAILILLLKTAKVNHIYQFECIASEIVAACCVPTFLRFFNHDVNRHVSQRSSLQHPHSPFKAISVDLCLCQSGLDTSTTELFGLSWRNTFSHINLLRILNKVVKGKTSRILMLRMFKAQHCLKRCLNVMEPLFQQYTLKLLKHMCKYLDQEWKRNNQRIISAIYHKVRHRMLDDWIGEISLNKIKKRPEKSKATIWPWDHQKEELRLHQDIIEYLTRRFGLGINTSSAIEGWEVLSDTWDTSNEYLDVQLPESCIETYELWMEQEVLNKTIKWDALIKTSTLV